MIQIHRLLARQLRSILKKALHPIPPSSVLTMRSGDDGLFVEAQGPNHAVQYHDPRAQDRDQMLVPFDLLNDVQGSKTEAVFLTRPRAGVLAASWEDQGVCHEMEYDEPEPVADAQPFPERPAHFTENPPTLFNALRDAFETTDVGSARYALHCIQLRADGVIAATDGRQLLRQAGFQFPVAGEALVQHTKFFRCKELPHDEPLRIGKTDNHVVFQFGPWTHWVALQKEGRFPNIEQVIPPTHYAPCTLQLTPWDSRFLLENMHRLPNGTTHRELTIDLNGSVVLRAASASTPRPAEMILRNSSKQGADVRICTDRRFLIRAAELGFSEFHLPNDASPAVATDASRTYLWMLLDPKEAIQPSDNCLRIESPLGSHPRPAGPTKHQAAPVNRVATALGQNPESAAQPVPPPATVNDSGASRSQPGRSGKASSALEQAISLRAQLRAAMISSQGLIRSLKLEKQSQKALKIALNSRQQRKAVA